MPTRLSEAQLVDERQAWSVRMIDSVIERHRRLGPSAVKWHYEHGFVRRGVEQAWLAAGEARYQDFIRDYLEALIEPDGTIRTYRLDEYNLDQINPGKLLFGAHRATGEARYRRALDLLRRQLQAQPRTKAGGFWHKQIYPYQIWLDGLYMAGPFYAEYAVTFDEPAGLDDVVGQLVLTEARTRDPDTGLLYHAWDESRQQRWANPETGCSPHFWGRAMGWYAMALVDVLDHVPAGHPGRDLLTAILGRLAEAVAGVQEPDSGLWYQVLDQGSRAGNYLESSAACMFIYALAKGARQGVLPADRLRVAQRAYRGVLEQFITLDDGGLVTLERTCSVAGLGGTPYRDGSFGYYVGEPIASNDYKGVGAFILASIEMEKVRARYAPEGLAAR